MVAIHHHYGRQELLTFLTRLTKAACDGSFTVHELINLTTTTTTSKAASAPPLPCLTHSLPWLGMRLCLLPLSLDA